VKDKERTCIVQSHQAHLGSARRRLSDGCSFDSPLKGFTGGVKWEVSYRRRIKQVALLPVALSFVFLLVAAMPVMYLAHRWALIQRKRKTVKEIRALEKEDQPWMDVPDKKVLEHLWAHHGLHADGHNIDEKIELLNRWVITLYGQEVADAHSIKAQFDEIGLKQLEANRGYYEGQEDSHIHFASPFDALLAKLSKELPAYQ